MTFRGKALGLIFLLAGAVGGATYFSLRAPMPKAAPDDALTWVRYEFALSGEQMARIERLHAAYQGVCEEHCLAIQEARAQVRALKAAQAEPAVIAAAEAKAKEVDLICSTSLEKHLREIAAAMGDEAGRRYLAVVMPRLAQFDHSGAPDLGVNPTAHRAGHSGH